MSNTHEHAALIAALREAESYFRTTYPDATLTLPMTKASDDIRRPSFGGPPGAIGFCFLVNGVTQPFDPSKLSDCLLFAELLDTFDDRLAAVVAARTTSAARALTTVRNFLHARKT